MMRSGDVVGEYELVEHLGGGSFGEVWKAQHGRARWTRAVKFAKDPALVDQFSSEAAVLGELDHPHIVRVYELTTRDEIPAIVLEYVDGPDLAKRLEDGPLPWQDAVRIALETLEALQAAHEAGLIHRDIKPSNILLTAEGDVKVADFGLVSAAERAGSVRFSRQEEDTSSVAGTAHYMAPEYEERARPSPQADLFSLGVVLYQCLTGRLPRAFSKPPSEAGDCAQEIDSVIMALLADDPEDRPASAAEAHDTLAKALHHGLKAEQEAQARQEAEGRKAREAEEQQRREAERVARQAERERHARQQRERARAAGKQIQRLFGALLRDRWVQIAAAVVGAVLLVGGILSSALKHPDGTTEVPDSGGTAVVVQQAGRVAGDGSMSSPGFRAGDQVTGPDEGTYVWVPAGEFMMGSHDGRSDEKPVHKVKITKGFWLGKHEVTNEQYAAFLNAYGGNTESDSHELLDVDDEDCEIEERDGRYAAKSGREQHPVVEVSWYGAVAYCNHYGLRLPTEAEWEYAARGLEGRRYPWGDEWDSEKCCNWENRKAYSGADTFPVGSFPDGASWCGALDMAGNMWEWCSDWYDGDYYGNSPCVDPAGPVTGTARLLRGGAWSSSDWNRRSTYRFNTNPDGTNDMGGFRCSRTSTP